jgi:hypothetical protein
MTAARRAGHSGHEHVRGEACGHVTAPHTDRVDYVHDGHREHVDEH